MATKAAKSITINATKYELANTLGVADGKIQLKAKDVVLDEANLPAGGKYIAITLVRDADSDVGNKRRGYLIDSIETSDNIDPTTYTGQDMANDFLAGGLKIVAFVPSNGWSDNSYIEISELNVFDNSEDSTPDFYYTFLGAGFSTAVGNDTIKYKLSVDGLSTADTLDTLENGYHHAALYNCLDVWGTPSVKITKCKVLAPSSYAKGFLEAMAVNDSVTCTIPSGFPKKGEVDSGFNYGEIQGADLIIRDSNDTNTFYAFPLQFVHASGGIEPRYAYFTLYDGKVFRTVLSNAGGTSQWDITRVA